MPRRGIEGGAPRAGLSAVGFLRLFSLSLHVEQLNASPEQRPRPSAAWPALRQAPESRLVSRLYPQALKTPPDGASKDGPGPGTGVRSMEGSPRAFCQESNRHSETDTGEGAMQTQRRRREQNGGAPPGVNWRSGDRREVRFGRRSYESGAPVGNPSGLPAPCTFAALSLSLEFASRPQAFEPPIPPLMMALPAKPEATVETLRPLQPGQSPSPTRQSPTRQSPTRQSPTSGPTRQRAQRERGGRAFQGGLLGLLLATVSLPVSH